MRSPNKPDREFGSVLLGSATDRILNRRVRVQTLLTSSLVLANFVGAVCAISLATIGIPAPSVFLPRLWWVHFIAMPTYVGLAFVVGIGWGTYSISRKLTWFNEGNTPTAIEARTFHEVPRTLVALQGGLWGTGAIVFTLMYGNIQSDLITKVLCTILMSGTVVVSVSQLLIDFSLRPVAAEILRAGYKPSRRGGIRIRMVVSWLAGSGVPLFGIILVVVFGTFRRDTSKLDLLVGVVTLAAVALFTGLLLTLIAATSITDPIRAVRTGMAAVASGNTNAGVTVYDGTELGDLQAGFNSMVDGLRERDQMKDMFGRHVGRNVAAAALTSRTQLGGTECAVGIVFVDVIGSTRLAVERSPSEVVDMLNSFFSVIVESVDAHDGLVNKFQGDAALAIFGAPVPLDNAASAALSAAREICHRLTSEVPFLTAGIGVSFGQVIAGNIGAIERFEYTVIGDAVNESARLSELAKRNPSQPLASGRALQVANSAEFQFWERAYSSTLRGRGEPTEIFSTRRSCQASD